MTAVIGLLNKRGVAIAADSAVTRTRGNNVKCTKNGNKMLRMSDAVPISVMTTGNGNYIRNPWDVVVRQYRKERGDIRHETVVACVHDFFDYIAKNDAFWDEDYIKHWINEELNDIFQKANSAVPWELRATKSNGTFVKHKAYLKAFIQELHRIKKNKIAGGVSHQFVDYTIERFREYAKSIIDEYFDSITLTEKRKYMDVYSTSFLDAIRADVEDTLMASLTCRSYEEGFAELVFSGYGESQEYPSLVSAIVYEGFDHRVNYHIRPEDIVCISDERPVAYCPFAQRDVAKSIIRGQHRSWLTNIMRKTEKFYNDVDGNLFEDKFDDHDMEFIQMLSEVKYDDLIEKYRKSIINLLDKNQKQWEKTLENYVPRDMAALAHCLIDMTGLHRILTFEQEGVGGPVDVAVITKNDGFVWLSRKSWYHHKDVNGIYGSMGI